MPQIAVYFGAVHLKGVDESLQAVRAMALYGQLWAVYVFKEGKVWVRIFIVSPPPIRVYPHNLLRP